MNLTTFKEPVPLETFAEQVKVIDNCIETRTFRGERIDYIERDGQSILLLNDEEAVITEHGMNQFLARLGIPVSYHDKCPLELKTANIRHWLNNREISTYKTFAQGDQKFLIGVGTAAERQLTASNMISALGETLSKMNKDIHVESCYLDPYQMQFRATLPSTNREPVVGDVYSYGFHIQLSEVRQCPVIIAPLVYRLVCSNGLVDASMQNKILKAKSASIARDALTILFEDLFQWIENDGSKNIFDALASLHETGIKYNKQKVDSYLSKATSKLHSSYIEQFVSAVYQKLPTGIAESPKVTVPAYEFYQHLTETAKILPPHVRNAVEKNVAQALLA